MSFLRSILFALLALASLCIGATEFREDSDTITNHVDDSYLPEFLSISRSIIGRADEQSTGSLQNNVPATVNSIQPGGKQTYVFPLSALQGQQSTSNPLIPVFSDRSENVEHHELRKRTGSDVTYYFSLSVCSQPTSNTSSASAPQVSVVLSYSNPKADGTGNNPHTPEVVNGYASFSDDTSTDVFISVQAPDAPGFTGSWTYELVVSIDQYYTSYVNTSTLYFVDADNSSAMFVSGNLTQFHTNGSTDNSSINIWKKIGPQFSVYLVDEGDSSLNGLNNSYCALKNTTQLGNATSDQGGLIVETGVTDIAGPALQQQFYVSGLQSDRNYLAAMGLKSNYTTSGSGQPGGGGTLYNQVAFTTKIAGSCQIIYNLTFCPQINYAVPANRTRFNRTDLANWYNNQSESNYIFFKYALDQIACNTSSDSLYSLAVGCDTCNQTYKDWLCTVMSPRCHDYSSQKPYLHARAINQSFSDGSFGDPSKDPQFNATFQNMRAFTISRNPLIDTEIMPGPYKELLPCGDVCNKLVRSCPAALGFGCPYNPQNYNYSYGYESMDGNLPMCNYPGKVVSVSMASVIRPAILALLASSILLLSLG